MKGKIGKIIIDLNASCNIVKLEDVSDRHKHHGHGFSGESHFEVVIQMPESTKLEKILFQKDVGRALAPLYHDTGVHSISIEMI